MIYVAFFGARIGEHDDPLLLEASHVDMIPLLEEPRKLSLLHVPTDNDMGPFPYRIIILREFVLIGDDVGDFGTSCGDEDDGNRYKSRNEHPREGLGWVYIAEADR